MSGQPTPESLIRTVGFVGQSKALVDAAQTVAVSKVIFGSNVLIIGETGTGKSHLSKYLHEAAEKEAPVFHVDCPRYSSNLELFKMELCGNTNRTPFPPLECGRFTSAKQTWRRVICLHRINYLHIGLQSAIKSLMNETCYPNSYANPVKIIATATLDIKKQYLDPDKVSEGFLTSFLYVAKIPALRDRVEDIEPLIEHFADVHFKEKGARRSFSPELIKLMKRYEWPGNAHEVQAAVHNLIEAKCEDDELGHIFLKERVTPEYFPGYDKRLISPLRLVPPQPEI